MFSKHRIDKKFTNISRLSKINPPRNLPELYTWLNEQTPEAQSRRECQLQSLRRSPRQKPTQFPRIVTECDEARVLRLSSSSSSYTRLFPSILARVRISVSYQGADTFSSRKDVPSVSREGYLERILSLSLPSTLPSIERGRRMEKRYEDTVDG